MSRNKIKRCACGLPLHYRDKAKEVEIQTLVDELGEWMPVSVGIDRYLVQRHYIALHGLKGDEVRSLMQKGIVKTNN